MVDRQKIKIIKHLEEGELEEALDVLLIYANQKNDSKLLQLTILQNRKYYEIDRDQKNGLSSREIQEIQRNRIEQVIRSIIDKF